MKQHPIPATPSTRAALCLLLCAGNATAQNPAPAPTPVEPAPLEINEIAFGLNHPWALAFLPEGGFLVTERSGQLRMIDERGRVSPPLAGVPEVFAQGQGGLLDLVLDRNFSQNRRIFFCFAEPEGSSSNRSSTALASATLAKDLRSITDVNVIFHQLPRIKSELHFGCRIAQAKDSSLFLTLGERSHAREQAQRRGNHLGKIVRLLPDGSPHPDNPFLNGRNGTPDLWSWGHRNPQGAIIAPDGTLWVHEHGPQGGDELNIIRRSKNYGWPTITYGVNYGSRGTPIGEGTHKQGMEQPVHQWTPSIAPSGMAYLQSDRYGPQWQDSLFIGSLRFGTLHRLKANGTDTEESEVRLVGRGERIRDVREGPDGLLYLLTDSPNGRLLRVEPPPPAPPATEAASGTSSPNAIAHTPTHALDATAPDAAAPTAPTKAPAETQTPSITEQAARN